eukprot:jgi/Tetstr1/435295/TSEL_024214.t1
MGLNCHTFYNRLRNQTSFTVDEIRRLFAVVSDPRFVHFLLDGTPFMPAERQNPGESETDGAARDEDIIQRGAERITFESADILKAAFLALSDRRIDHREAHAIKEEIDTAEPRHRTTQSHPADPSARESAPAAPPKTRDTREERLAAALRANLRKRKAAARPRSQ